MAITVKTVVKMTAQITVTISNPAAITVTVAPGTDVSFQQNGPIASTNIGCLGPSSFNLGPIGTYQILFRVSVTEAGQRAALCFRAFFSVFRLPVIIEKLVYKRFFLCGEVFIFE